VKKTHISIELDGDTEKVIAALKKLGVSPHEAVRQSLADSAKKLSRKAAKSGGKFFLSGVGSR
jgi:hypothetical protein